MPQVAPLWLVAIAGEGGAAAIMIGLQASVTKVAISAAIATTATKAKEVSAGVPELPPAQPPSPPRFWRETVDSSLLKGVRIRDEPGGVGPVVNLGSCLASIGLNEGDFLYIHPTRPARDGDLVLVELTDGVMQFVAGSEDGKAHAERLGGLSRYAVKALFSCGLTYYLVHDAGILDELGNCKVWPIIRVEKGALSRLAREFMHADGLEPRA